MHINTQIEAMPGNNPEYLAAILDSLSDGIIACDKNGMLTIFNHSSHKFHKFPEQPISPEQWADQYNLYEKDGITPMMMEHIPLYRALHGESVLDQEMVIIPSGGKPHTVLATGRQLVSRTGEVLGAAVCLRDVTMVKAQEVHLRQSQKLDSIGILAGGIAHDFNNILTIIVGATALLEDSSADNRQQLMIIEQISSSAKRAAMLTQSLLAFSRKQGFRKLTEDLGSVIRNMQDFLGRVIGNDILLTLYVPDEPVMVMIDRGQIEQVLMNLAVNARDAMPSGGVLTVSLSIGRATDDHPELEGRSPGEYSVITVSDNGEGIDAITQQRIFEPFFTTRVRGKGTGLGLSMAYGIVRQHEGIIHVDSAPGEGTTFKIYLPLQEQLVKAAIAHACEKSCSPHVQGVSL